MGKVRARLAALRDRARAAAGSAARGARRAGAAAWSIRAELLLGLAVVAGWALITVAIARVARADVVWPLSGGLFALSLAGWRLLWQIAGHGFYALTREEGGRRGA